VDPQRLAAAADRHRQAEDAKQDYNRQGKLAFAQGEAGDHAIGSIGLPLRCRTDGSGSRIDDWQIAGCTPLM
jgi:hypothetical protein